MKRAWALFVAIVLVGGRLCAAESPTPSRAFISLPGPNPILMCGTPNTWDESVIEACDIVKEGQSYYLFYHGHGFPSLTSAAGYRIGLATAPRPLGPWSKQGNRPVLEVGSEGSWDDHDVACAAIVKESPGRFLMWYSARSKRSIRHPKPAGPDAGWDVGLATAARLEGPWTKHPGNPLLRNFGYVGGVLKTDGQYRMYTEHPIGSIIDDYGPLALATAALPTGPWTPWKGNPILPGGAAGAWDDCGCSEAKVTFWDDCYHLFYGGAKQHQTRMSTRESIGYATSSDGLHFTRHPANPVAPRDAEPNAAAYAEVHTLVEPPLIYAYHTLRYVDPRQVTRAAGRTSVLEDIGVQILAMRRPFRMEMPLLSIQGLAPGARSHLADCPPLRTPDLAAAYVAVQADLTAFQNAHQGLRIHILRSSDGQRYVERAGEAFDVARPPGAVAPHNVPLDPQTQFIKTVIENLDSQQPCRSVSIVALLGG